MSIAEVERWLGPTLERKPSENAFLSGDRPAPKEGISRAAPSGWPARLDSLLLRTVKSRDLALHGNAV